MISDSMIKIASKLLGIPRNSIKAIFKDDETDDAIYQKLVDIENLSLLTITSRLNMDELYNSFIAECMDKNMSDEEILKIAIVNNDELNVKVFRQSSNNAKNKLFEWIRNNDSTIKIKYIGKNNTSHCSKLPHIPHYDSINKAFCCGVSGDIELLNYIIRIVTIIDKVNGNKNRYSAMKGAYRIHIIEKLDNNVNFNKGEYENG